VPVYGADDDDHKATVSSTFFGNPALSDIQRQLSEKSSQPVAFLSLATFCALTLLR
jgi:hypothetical protein